MALRVGIFEVKVTSKMPKYEFTFETGALLKFTSTHSNENAKFSSKEGNFRLSAKRRSFLPKAKMT